MDPILSCSPQALSGLGRRRPKRRGSNKPSSTRLSVIPEEPLLSVDLVPSAKKLVTGRGRSFDFYYQRARSTPEQQSALQHDLLSPSSDQEEVEDTPDSGDVEDLDTLFRRLDVQRPVMENFKTYKTLWNLAFGKEDAAIMTRRFREAYHNKSGKDVPTSTEWNREMKSTAAEIIRCIEQRRTNPGVPNLSRMHMFVYPERNSKTECALNTAVCDGGHSTHDTAQVIAIMKFLQWQRRVSKEWHVLPDFGFDSKDFDPSLPADALDALSGTFQRFLDQHITTDEPGKKYILLCECGSCGDTKNLFAAESHWGHRTLLIFEYLPSKHQFVGTVEYYDSLGDWAMHSDDAVRNDGISMSRHFLQRYVQPLLTNSPTAQLLRMPSMETNSNADKTRSRLFVQHPREFMCQNWVPFFADARMSGITPQILQQWFAAFQPCEEGEGPFGTDFALMVTFHLFHLRRWVNFYFDEFNQSIGNVYPAEYKTFGLKWGNLDGLASTRDEDGRHRVLRARHFYSIFGVPAKEVNEFCLTKVAWLGWLNDLAVANEGKKPRHFFWPFPTDLMTTAFFDPLFPLVQFASTLPDHSQIHFHSLNRSIMPSHPQDS